MLKILGPIATLVFVLVAPLSADAQQPKKVPRVGILVYGNPLGPNPEDSVVQGLRELGWIDGQNFVLVPRYAGGRPERLADLAAELVRSRVDLIVSVGTDVVRVARKATDTIPIVMGASEDPVEIGLVASLARPGGNVTGVTFISSEVSGKRLELLKEAVPGISRVAVLWNPTHVDLDFRELQVAGRALGVEVHSVEVRSPEELDGAFRAVASGRADALVVVPSRLMNLNAKRIADFALERRLPAVSMWSSFAEAGGLMTYGPNIPAMIRRAATHADKILKGARPGDLPVERPTRFDLVINLKTANALGLTIPQSLLLRADRVIQ